MKKHSPSDADTTDSGVTKLGKRNGNSRFWRRFRRHRLAVIGAFFLLLLVIIALFAPLLSAHDPYQLDPRATKDPPSTEHFLGTDTAGR